MIRSWTMLLTSCVLTTAIATEPAGLRKLKSLADNPSACQRALASSDSLMRRAAFRQLLAQKAQVRTAIEQGLKDSDPLIRQRALYEGFTRYGNAFLPQLKSRIKDDNFRVGTTLIAIAQSIKPQELSTQLLQTIADKAGNPEIRRQASRLVNFTFYRENKRLRDNPAVDREIITVKSWELSRENWRFKVDPMVKGQNKNYYAPQFNDARWKKLKIGVWEQQGYPGYDGVAWYRKTFNMPKKIDSNAVEIVFGAVDESAWVWLNGVYIGQHDIGPNGWDRPFALDVTKEIQWGGKNTLVVRVEDTTSAGGIWKPVKVEILK